MSPLFRQPDPASPSPWLRPEIVAPWWEILLVTALLVAPYAWSSTRAALHGSGSRYVEMILSDPHLLKDAAIEAGVLSVFLFFLRWRHWTLPDFKIRANLRSSLQGLGLFLVIEVVHAVTLLGLFLLVYVLQTHYATFLSFFLSQSPHLKHHSIEVGWIVMSGTMILNAFFEELTCMGYFFTQIAAKQGPLVALLLTVLLRMACHTYQGPINAVSIGFVFMAAGLWYWKTRNLWPLIFAHAILDLFSTGMIKALFGH